LVPAILVFARRRRSWTRVFQFSRRPPLYAVLVRRCFRKKYYLYFDKIVRISYRPSASRQNCVRSVCRLDRRRREICTAAIAKAENPTSGFRRIFYSQQDPNAQGRCTFRILGFEPVPYYCSFDRCIPSVCATLTPRFPPVFQRRKPSDEHCTRSSHQTVVITRGFSPGCQKI